MLLSDGNPSSLYTTSIESFVYVSVHYMYTCSLYIDIFYISTAVQIVVNNVIKGIVL